MTEQIKKPIAELGKVVVGKPASHHPLPKAATKPLRQPSTSNIVGIAAILATALYLSSHSNYLFFKELLIAFSIIGMALLFRAFGEPKTGAAQSHKFDPSLN
jgi:hypothetical protein